MERSTENSEDDGKGKFQDDRPPVGLGGSRSREVSKRDVSNKMLKLLEYLLGLRVLGRDCQFCSSGVVSIASPRR